MRIRLAKHDGRDDWRRRRDASRHVAIQRTRSGLAQCHGETRSGAVVVPHFIVAFATRRGRSAARDATTLITHKCNRVVSTSRLQEFSSNCSSSAAVGTTLQRCRTVRVVRALSQRDQTEQRASESNASRLGEGLCMRGNATKLRRPH